MHLLLRNIINPLLRKGISKEAMIEMSLTLPLQIYDSE